MTGSTDAIASASKASKKVATPTMIRALTCHHEMGRRSSRATMSSTDARVPATPMFSSPWLFFRPCGLARLCPRQFQKSRRGVEADGVSHAVLERHAIDEMPGLLDRFEGIIGGEHHMVMAERTDRAVERLRRAHARGRHHDVVLDVLRGAFRELDRVKIRPCAAVETPEQERQGFAQVPEREPGAREAANTPPNTMRKACEPVSKVHSHVARRNPLWPFNTGAGVSGSAGWRWISASNACARSQKGSSERSSRYVPLVWPLIMAPQNLSSRMHRSSSSAAAAASCMGRCAKPE